MRLILRFISYILLGILAIFLIYGAVKVIIYYAILAGFPIFASFYIPKWIIGGDEDSPAFVVTGIIVLIISLIISGITLDYLGWLPEDY